MAGQQRLDMLQTTGLDLVVTELDIVWRDAVQRADAMEDVVRAYFAHPGVSGLFLWGFCSQHMKVATGMELVHGHELKVRLQSQGHLYTLGGGGGVIL